MSYVVKATARTIKNYTKGYSDIQAKVRSATSNDHWGPSGTLMNEIAQATYNHNEFTEIMEMIDKRLNDHGKNWRHVFKALTLLDYCLLSGSEEVVNYAKANIYVVKTLTEFQYIDEDGKDQGSNVRQKAKEITSLLQDEERLKQERQNRNDMRRRMGSRSDHSAHEPSLDRSVEQPGYLDDESEMQRAIEESKRSAQEHEARIKESEKDEVERALRLSKEEEEKRLTKLAEQNEKPLIDTSGFGNNPYSQQPTDFFGQNSQYGNNQFSQYSGTSSNQYDPFDNTQNSINYNLLNNNSLNSNPLNNNLLNNPLNNNPYQMQPSQITNPYQQMQPSAVGSNNPFAQQKPDYGSTTSYGTSGINMSTSNFSSPNLSTFDSFSSSKQSNFDNLLQSQEITKRPQDEKHSKLASLIATGGEGMDTFGNIGSRRVPVGSGFANSLSVPSPRRSNSTGDISVNQANPFLNTGGSGGGGYNTFTTTNPNLYFGSTSNNTFNQDANQSITPFSSTSYATNTSLIDLGDVGGGFNTPPSKNPFQIQTPNTTNTYNAKPASLNELARSNQQNSPFYQNNPGGFSSNW